MARTIAPQAATAEAKDSDLAATPTPMMAQYCEIKAANADCLLFYRMGDFFELFFDDALVASQALGITLTKRGKHLGEDIPMCGVPVHAADDYLQKLIRLGHRVAVCEQTEDPAEAKKRGGKSVVRRDVVRLVTPGTLTEDSLLEARANNFLLSLFALPGVGGFALAALDISTGDFLVAEVAPSDLGGELARLAPREVLCADALMADDRLLALIREAGAALTPCPSGHFDSQSGLAQLKARLGVADIAGFGALSRGELAAIAAVLTYVELTQLGKTPLIRPPRKSYDGRFLIIDAATRANLELVTTARGERKGSLLGAIDRTVTAAGGRLLARRMAAPSTEPHEINRRLDCLAAFVSDSTLRASVREALRGMPDLVRVVSRLSVGRGGPRDLGAVRDGLDAAHTLADRLARGRDLGGGGAFGEALREIVRRIDPDVLVRLTAALGPDLPAHARDGGFIATGYDAGLDELRGLSDETRSVIERLQARYQDDTGIRALKLKHNNLLGYFLEAPAAQATPLTRPPLSAQFRHRQTLANAMRFSTDTLAELDARIASAAARALALELALFDDLAAACLRNRDALTALADTVAELDVASALAELAATGRYCRPEITDDARLIIKGGRHPAVEQALSDARGAAFIENDCSLAAPDAHGRPGPRLWLITGPNMAGKSTFLRQTAIIALMAQMGSYVPAASAEIGIVDRLFSRVGAADDLARGRSTFMVEMVETAAILNQATARSLVILDEIGRGTATYDGLSIAWSAVEYLHDRIGCRALFATHYHELTALAAKLAHAANATVAVREWQDEIVFLYKVREGAADRSYGLQVAKLAGLPPALLARARAVLDRLEAADQGPRAETILEDLPLFAATRPRSAPQTPADDALRIALAAIRPDDLSPREALEALYSLKALLNAGKSETG